MAKRPVIRVPNFLAICQSFQDSSLLSSFADVRRLRAGVGVHLNHSVSNPKRVFLGHRRAESASGSAYLALATGEGDVDESAGVCEPLLRTALGELLLLLGLNLGYIQRVSDELKQNLPSDGILLRVLLCQCEIQGVSCGLSEPSRLGHLRLKRHPRDG